MPGFQYFKVKKVQTEFNTLSLVYSEGDEVYLYNEADNTQLFGVKTDNVDFLQRQHPECEVEEVRFDDIKEELQNSPQAVSINKIVVNMIKHKYSYDDEIKLLNKAINSPTDADYLQYRSFVDACREQGREMKIKVGVLERL